MGKYILTQVVATSPTSIELECQIKLRKTRSEDMVLFSNKSGDDGISFYISSDSTDFVLDYADQIVSWTYTLNMLEWYKVNINIDTVLGVAILTLNNISETPKNISGTYSDSSEAFRIAGETDGLDTFYGLLKDCKILIGGSTQVYHPMNRHSSVDISTIFDDSGNSFHSSIQGSGGSSYRYHEDKESPEDTSVTEVSAPVLIEADGDLQNNSRSIYLDKEGEGDPKDPNFTEDVITSDGSVFSEEFEKASFDSQVTGDGSVRRVRIEKSNPNESNLQGQPFLEQNPEASGYLNTENGASNLEIESDFEDRSQASVWSTGNLHRVTHRERNYFKGTPHVNSGDEISYIDSNLRFYGDFEIEVKFRIKRKYSGYSYMGIIGNRSNDPREGYFVYIGSNTLYLACRNSIYTGSYDLNGGSIEDNSWTTIKIVRKDNIGSFYVNGELKESVTYPDDLNPNPDQNWLIGRSGFGSSYGLDGEIEYATLNGEGFYLDSAGDYVVGSKGTRATIYPGTLNSLESVWSKSTPLKSRVMKTTDTLIDKPVTKSITNDSIIVDNVESNENSRKRNLLSQKGNPFVIHDKESRNDGTVTEGLYPKNEDLISEVDAKGNPLELRGKAQFNASENEEGLIDLDPNNVLDRKLKEYKGESLGDKIKQFSIDNVITSNITEGPNSDYIRDDYVYGVDEDGLTCEPDFSFISSSGKPAVNTEEITDHGMDIRRFRNSGKLTYATFSDNSGNGTSSVTGPIVPENFTSFKIEVYARFTKNSATRTLVSQWATGAGGQGQFAIAPSFNSDSNNITFSYVDEGINTHNHLVPISSYIGYWALYSMELKDDVMSIYINNTLIHSEPCSGLRNTVAYDFRLGGLGSTSSYGYDDDVADVKVYVDDVLRSHFKLEGDLTDSAGSNDLTLVYGSIDYKEV